MVDDLCHQVFGDDSDSRYMLTHVMRHWHDQYGYKRNTCAS